MSAIFGERLQEARLKKGLLQREVEEKAGIAQGMLSVYERGKYDPRLFTLVLLADTLDVSTDYLLGRDDYDKGRIKKPNFRI